MAPQYLVEHQSRDHEPTAYEQRLAGAIEEVFATGVHDLPGLIEGLRIRGVHGPGSLEWDEESFCAEMARLGV